MQNRPLIGVPTQTLQVIDGIPEGLPHSWVMNNRYFIALTTVGGVPVMVPLLDSDEDTLRAMYDHFDGIFLAGGVDIDPDAYGQVRHELCGSTDRARDAVEILFARWAIEDGKPLFGVCRGMQVINVAAGGTLVQDTGALFDGSIKHDYFPTAGYARDYLAHTIDISPDSRLASFFCAAGAHVNSMHHQGIEALGGQLVATATAPDGLVEAIEADLDSFVLGVQWHPEMLIDHDAGTRRMFAGFVQAALTYRESRAALT